MAGRCKPHVTHSSIVTVARAGCSRPTPFQSARSSSERQGKAHGTAHQRANTRAVNRTFNAFDFHLEFRILNDTFYNRILAVGVAAQSDLIVTLLWFKHGEQNYKSSAVAAFTAHSTVKKRTP
jgi:hypothetical protein